jgi:hypothetical protein
MAATRSACESTSSTAGAGMGAYGRGGVVVMVLTAIGSCNNGCRRSTRSGGDDNYDSGSVVHTIAIAITVPRCLAPLRAEL